jgi:large exoprotein involved in heme utilization and adhesion
LDFKAGGRINAYTLGAGKAGTIDVTADQIMISAVGAPNNTCCTGIIASTGNNGAGTGAGGVVKVTAKELTIMGAPTAGAQIANNVVGQGPGGALTVDVKGPLSISMGSADPNLATGIFANTFTAQAGAKLMITAGSLELLTRGSIAARTSGTGPSGGATVQVTGYEYKLMENGPTIKVPGDVLIKDGSSIRTDGLAGGNAGMLDLTAEGDISIIGFPTGDNPYAADLTGLVTNANTGQGGKLFVRAQNLTVKDRASIQSQVRGARDGGAITFDLTGTLLVNSGGQVNSSTAGTGNGGPIMIKANSVVVSSPSLERIIVSGNPDISGSGIASQAQANRGAGGSITIKTRILQVLDGGDIDVRTLGPGNAGTIDITAMESVLVSGIKQGAVDFYNSIGVSPDSARSSIASGTESKNLGAATPGLAGAIRITTPHLMVTEGGLLSSRTLTPAAGGSIEAMTDRITLSGDAKIDAASAQNIGVGTGKAGDIVLKAAQSFESDNSTVSTSADLGLGGNIQIATGESARLTNNTLISATSDGPGDAGSITLDGGKVLRAIGSTITGEATQAGGGNVTLIADDLIHLTRTNVTASVQGGPQTIGGNVLFDPQIILLQGSKVIAQATQGTGGTIKLVASTVLADPSSLISASSQSGPQGTVTVQAPIQNLSGAMVPMQQEYMPAMTLLSQRCAARVSEGKISTFVVTLREGLPPEPGGPLPSPLEELDRAVTQAEAQPLLIASVTGTGSLGLIGLPGSVLVSDEPCRR